MEVGPNYWLQSQAFHRLHRNGERHVIVNLPGRDNITSDVLKTLPASEAKRLSLLRGGHTKIPCTTASADELHLHNLSLLHKPQLFGEGARLLRHGGMLFVAELKSPFAFPLRDAIAAAQKAGFEVTGTHIGRRDVVAYHPYLSQQLTPLPSTLADNRYVLACRKP